MSYTTYFETRDELERRIAKWQSWIDYLSGSDKTEQEKKEGIAVVMETIIPIKAQLDELNMSYYGTAVLYR